MHVPGGSAGENVPTSAGDAGDTQAWSLGREGPLEQEVATHSSVLVWNIPWNEEPSRLQSMGLQRVEHEWAPQYHMAHASFGIYLYLGR